MMADSSTSQESVVLERVFDAPIGLVWKMWTDPVSFRAWYGPTGATVPVAELDVEPGGHRRVCMELGPTQMWFTGQYVEVIEPTRLVYIEVIADENGQPVTPESLGMPANTPGTTEVTVVLEEVAGGTRVTLTHAGVPAESGAARGWTGAFDKLAAELRKAPAA
jgi:uncharacterized protein YndB with AHSA1/START domain